MLGSQRIYEDLTLALEHPRTWSQHMVVRQWVSVPIEYEFRGFVYNNKLTCLSQYYHYCYFPGMVQIKSKIEQMIQAYFEKIKDVVPLRPQEYVVDFAVDVDNDKVYIIEINPFGNYEAMGTSTSMFDKKRDAAILFGDGWEFRVELGSPEDIFKIM